MDLELGAEDTPFKIDSDFFLQTRTCILAGSGSGKSNLIKLICKELVEKNLGFCVIDVEGEYDWLHRKHGVVTVTKLPVGESSPGARQEGTFYWGISDDFVKRMGKRAHQSGPLVLNLHEVDEGERNRLIGLFLASLAEVYGTAPYLLILDEVQKYGGDPALEKTIKDIIHTGRKRKLGVLLATQQPSEVRGLAIGGFENQIVGLLNTGDVRIFEEIFGEHKPPVRIEDLTIGHFYFFGGLKKSESPVHVREVPKEEPSASSPESESDAGTIAEMYDDYEAEQLAQQSDIKDLLLQAGLCPAPELKAFLEAQRRMGQMQGAGLAIDYHVILPDCLFLADSGQIGSRRHSVKTAEVALQDTEVLRASQWNLTLDELGRHLRCFRSEKWEDGIEDKIHAYIHNMNELPFLDSVPEGEPHFKIDVGSLHWSSQIAITEWMRESFRRQGEGGEKSDGFVNLHQRLMGASATAPRGVFMGVTAIHISVISRDNKLILIHRGQNVFTWPNSWSVSSDEMMNGKQVSGRAGDSDFYALGVRAVEEELGISNANPRDFKIMAFAGEYDDLEFSVHATYKSGLTAQQIKQRWEYVRSDAKEADDFLAVRADDNDIDGLMRILRYGVPMNRNGSAVLEKLHGDGAVLNILLSIWSRIGLDKTNNALARLIVNDRKKSGTAELRTQSPD